LKIENFDFASLIETWCLLEAESAKLAAQRRTQQDIDSMLDASNAYAYKVKLNQLAVEEDMMFHLEIAEASKNSVLKSLMLIIMPDLINSFKQLEIYKQKCSSTMINEHEDIMEYIVAKESGNAAASMRMHLKDIFDYSQKLKHRKGNGKSGGY